MLKQTVFKQFGKPEGFLGRVAGVIMAHRLSNKERNYWTIDLLDLCPTDRVLEIGFGPGLAIEKAAALAGHVVGVDHSEEMLRQATSRNSKAIRDGKVELKLASASDLPATAGPFDKIYAVNAFGFWPKPEECLARLQQMLTPGGRIALTVQSRKSGATDQDSLAMGEKIGALLEQAGFANVTTKIKWMKPVAAVCVLGYA